jgi:hypothetical protein
MSADTTRVVAVPSRGARVAASSTGEHIPLVNHVTCDASSASSLAWVLLADSFRGPRALRWLWVLIVAAGVFTVFPGLHRVTSVLIVVVLLIVIPSAGYLTMRKLARTLVPDGAQFASGFGRTEMRISGPQGETMFPYDVFAKADRRRDFILFRTVKRQRLILPAGLFPDDALDQVRAGSLRKD